MPAIAALVVLLAVAGAVLLLLPMDEPSVDGLQAVGDRPFGDRGLDVTDADLAVLSDGGTRLAVLAEGAVGLAQDGRIRPITERGTRVVDLAWFSDEATLLVAEGPAPTGSLAVVRIDGTVRGSIPLRPSVGFGGGHGLDIAPGGRRAVATAVDRPPLSQEQRHLVLVDLETGATRALTMPGAAPQETGPHHLDDGRIAYTEIGESGTTRPRLIDPVSGATAEVATAGTVVGTVGTSVVVQVERELVAVPAAGAGGRRRVLGRVPEGTAVTSVDASRGQAVVVDRRGRVQRLEIEPVRTSG